MNRMPVLPLSPLYPITSVPNRAGLSHVELAERFLTAGIRLFQVREKSMSDRYLLAQLVEIRRLCDQCSGKFVVNDRADLALASGADGVHLGQEDLPVQAARRLLGDSALIGLSTHNLEQFLAAQALGLSYVAVGPVFSTSTKKTSNPPLGLDFLGELIPHSRLPIVAIGGISIGNAASVLATGVTAVAVISDVVDSPDPGAQVRRYLRVLQPEV